MSKNKNKLYHEMSLLELIKTLIISKLPKGKEKLQKKYSGPPENVVINEIAIVLDGTVEDVIRCQNRLAALLLSGPDFVELPKGSKRPKIGITGYKDGKFIEPNNDLTEEKIEKLLENIEGKND